MGTRIEQIVARLNSMLEADRPAMAALLANRVPCNEKLADHPTCQVMMQHGGFYVGLLGVLNGLLGESASIKAIFDDPEEPGGLTLVRFEAINERV